MVELWNCYSVFVIKISGTEMVMQDIQMEDTVTNSHGILCHWKLECLSVTNSLFKGKMAENKLCSALYRS